MVVRLENVHKSFASGFLMRRQPVLQELSLAIAPGETYALLGANGAGKSTTLRILLGLSRPDRGGGSMLGAPLGEPGVRRRLGYLPENPIFHEQLTGEEFLRFCGSMLGLGGAGLTRRLHELLERVELTGARKVRLRKMSKGMLQRLGLAQALLGDPELLILDEPMSGLDPPGRKLVRDLILEQRAAGKTVLFSTHILGDAELVCTRAGILRGGRVAAELQLEDLGRLRAEGVEVTVSGLRESDVQALRHRATAVVQSGRSVMFTVAPGESVHQLVREALAFGGYLESVVPRRASLEEIYLDVVRPAAEPEHSERPVQPARPAVLVGGGR